MRICYLGDNGSVHNQKWISSLSLLSGIDLHVVTFNHGVKFENVNYHYLKEYSHSKIDYLLNVPKVKSIVQSIQPDILHAHYATSYGFMGSMCDFHPYVITGWGSDIFDSPENPVLKSIIRRSLRKADAITVLSKIALVKMQSLTNKNIELIPFGIDTNKFIPVQKKPDEKIRIGTIRTLSDKYGVEYLIRAFAIISSKFPNVVLEIVGEGVLRESLQNLCRKLSISEKVTFHGYINQQSDFEKYSSILSRLDIFAILSVLDSETFGVACLEACACEIPVVATNVGGLPEVIIDRITGIIVPPKDPIQTAAAFEKLITNNELRMEMGKSGRLNVLQNFDWEKNLQLMVQLYFRLIKPIK